MAQKTHDLVVKTGEYQKGGETKSRYENIGTMMMGDNGPFIILKRTFNPAGVPNPECKDSVIVSCFEPQQQQNQQQAQQPQQQQAPQQQYQPNPSQPPQQQQQPNNGGWD